MAKMNRKQIVNAMINHVVNHGIYGMTVEGIEISQENYDKLVNMRKPLLADFLEKITKQEESENAEASVNADAPVEEPVNEADAEEAKYFHMHYQANFDKKLDDGTKTHVDFGCVVTFRLLDDGKWLCDKTSTNNLSWMLDPKFSYKGKWQKGVEREVIGCRTRSVHELKEWLTNGRYGQTVSQYLSQSEMPDYDKCEVGKPIAKGVKESDVQVTASDPVPF